MLSPYFVAINIDAVVMAESRADAEQRAIKHLPDIVIFEKPNFQLIRRIHNLEHLTGLNSVWNGDCVPYGGDGVTPIKGYILERYDD